MPEREIPEADNHHYFRSQMDMAWTIMLYKQQHISLEDTKKLINALKDISMGDDVEDSWNADFALKAKLDNDEDLASMVNFGRTQQEPITRLKLRPQLIETIDELIALMDTLLTLADSYKEVAMQGQSHMSAAQPNTYGAYLLALHEAMFRGLEQLDISIPT